jgi:type II secretion system protein H
MKANKQPAAGSAEGFTLVEVIIVISIMGIIAIMAAPSFIQWSRNLQYRSAAMSVVSVLRQARNQAITTNREQQVAFNPSASGFGIQAGDRANNVQSSGWGAATNWVSIPSTVITSPATTIRFIPDGVASSGTSTVQIKDTSGAVHFYVTVTQIGRISVTTP